MEALAFCTALHLFGIHSIWFVFPCSVLLFFCFCCSVINYYYYFSSHFWVFRFCQFDHWLSGIELFIIFVSRERKNQRSIQSINTVREMMICTKVVLFCMCVRTRANFFFAFSLVDLKCPEAKEVHRQKKEYSRLRFIYQVFVCFFSLILV